MDPSTVASPGTAPAIDPTTPLNLPVPSTLIPSKSVAGISSVTAQERKEFRTDYTALSRHVAKGSSVAERVEIRQNITDALKIITDGVKVLRQQYSDGVASSILFTRVQRRQGVNDLLTEYRAAIIDSIAEVNIAAFDKSLEAKRVVLYDIYDKLEIIRRVQLMLKK